MVLKQYDYGFYGLAEDMNTREILAANLRKLQAKHPGLASAPSIERATAAMPGERKIGRTTVQRMLDGTTPVNLDYVETIANLFSMDAWQLLVPGMDPKHPPTLRTVGQSEAQLYEKLDSLVKEFKSETSS